MNRIWVNYESSYCENLKSTLKNCASSYKKSKRIVQCKHCHKSFPNRVKLKNHSRVHKPRKVECNVCGKKFLFTNTMMKHKISVHLADYTHKCRFCETSFKTPLTLKQHVQNVHLKNYTFTCDKCGKGYFLKPHLDIHYKVEHEQLRFECKCCQKPFKTLQGLNAHIIVHDPSHKKKEYVCSECQAVFHSRSTYTLHVRKHKFGDEKYACEICGKSLSKKDSLKNHMRTHTGEKPFVCNICGRAFTTSNLLRTHLRIHTDEKPYICQICKKGFRQKPALNMHLRYHSGEKPYFCSVCGRAFISGTLLKNHRCLGPD